MFQIITKDFHGSSIRVIIINGKEYFVAKDIAELLGYLNTSKAVQDHCKKATNLKEILTDNESLPLDKTTIEPYRKLFGNSWHQTKLIPESDVWRLVIKSRLPEAEKIEQWIMEDVLPQIRKTGSYQIQQPTEKSLKQKVEDLELAVKHYENLEKMFKKFGNFSKRELAEKTSNSVFLETGIDFLKMFGGFPKDKNYGFQKSFTLTSLLEKHNIQMVTSEFNLKLAKIGIIERMGKNWLLLNLKFGRNESYKSEINPRYFAETFETLLKLAFLEPTK
jgi:prophage antirepressor-like protein